MVKQQLEEDVLLEEDVMVKQQVEGGEGQEEEDVIVCGLVSRPTHNSPYVMLFRSFFQL